MPRSGRLDPAPPSPSRTGRSSAVYPGRGAARRRASRRPAGNKRAGYKLKVASAPKLNPRYRVVSTSPVGPAAIRRAAAPARSRREHRDVRSTARENLGAAAARCPAQKDRRRCRAGTMQTAGPRSRQAKYEPVLGIPGRPAPQLLEADRAFRAIVGRAPRFALQFGRHHRHPKQGMPAFVRREKLWCQFVTAAVPDAEPALKAKLHKRFPQTSGRYWNSRIPGLTRGISPGLMA